MCTPLAPEISSQTPLPDFRTHVTLHHSSLAPLEPSIDHPRDPLVSPTDGSLSLGPPDNISKNPLLISSVVPSSPAEGDGHDSSSHAMVVESVVGVLGIPLRPDLTMETSHSEASLSPDEPDDDMILNHFQNEAKLEALARRGSFKSGSIPKKGRKSSNS